MAGEVEPITYEEVKAALEQVNEECEDYWKIGFLVARRIRTIMTRHGISRFKLPPHIKSYYPVIREVFDDEVALAAAEMWPKIEMDEDEDPMAVALKVAAKEVDEGAGVRLSFSFPSKEQQRLAQVIAAAAKILTDKNSSCFLPTRLLGQRLGCSHESVARIIRILRAHGVLELTATSTRDRAAEYKYVGPR